MALGGTIQNLTKDVTNDKSPVSRPLAFVDLFAGLGGFHLAMQSMGHHCVFASELDESLADLYEKNFSLRPEGDIREISVDSIPRHDILCAGFPCQPFSKAGEQRGTNCKLWGDLFSKHVLRIVRYHQPTFLLMENVANLERHDGGRTWEWMQLQLEKCGYEIDAKVLSPHHFGVPQIRERLLIVGSRVGLNHFTWPEEEETSPSIFSVLDNNPPEGKPIPDQVVRCLDVWQDFIQRAPKGEELPSFPIWTMEFGATYPYKKYNSLHDIPLKTLRNYKGCFGKTLRERSLEEIFARLPSYVRSQEGTFPLWKQHFIRQNRQYYERNKHWIKPWLPKIRKFPQSFQKFEWNCKGEDRDIWKFVIQCRASGVRIKRPITAPSLVAMTTTQVPIIAWERRYMTPNECARLQSMDELRFLPKAQTRVYKALGNAVNVEVVRRLAENLCSIKQDQELKKVA